MKKICFVIMGFGKKIDYNTGRILNLNKTYNNIIKPTVEKAGYICIRADEIRETGLIDKSMYALLYYADLVIADISTGNPNAIYELGIRHAIKPYSTLILKEGEGKIPFDLDHTRIFNYSHLGEDIGYDEVIRCTQLLGDLISEIKRSPKVDSPMYEYIEIEPPRISKEYLDSIMKELADQTNSIYAITEEALNIMTNIKENEDYKFLDAYHYWKKANKIKTEEYFIQQMALCKYKSDSKNVLNLTESLTIINELEIDTTNNPETLGIAGAIYKHLYLCTYDKSTLEKAIFCYDKGYKLKNSYYTGENLANCLDLIIPHSESNDEKIYYKFESQKTRKDIIIHLENIINFEDFKVRDDKHWIYATLANCYFHLNDNINFNKYEILFLSENPKEWNILTFYKNLNLKEELQCPKI